MEPGSSVPRVGTCRRRPRLNSETKETNHGRDFPRHSLRRSRHGQALQERHSRARLPSAKKYTIRYYTPAGERLKAKGYADKKATETLAAELERRAERIAAGRVDPADDHGKRPLGEHAEDFRRYLAAKGNTPDYVGKMLYRLTAVLDGCRFVKIGDVQSSAVVEYLGDASQGGQERQDGERLPCGRERLRAGCGATSEAFSTPWRGCRSWRTGKRTCDMRGRLHPGRVGPPTRRCSAKHQGDSVSAWNRPALPLPDCVRHGLPRFRVGQHDAGEFQSRR